MFNAKKSLQITKKIITGKLDPVLGASLLSGHKKIHTPSHITSRQMLKGKRRVTMKNIRAYTDAVAFEQSPKVQ